MNPIYREATYIFDVDITVSGSPADIRNDTVTMYLDKSYNVATPAITKVADVATDGLNGSARFELSVTDTAITPGEYHLQVVWALDGTTRKFVISDTIITVKEQVLQ